MKKLIVGMMCVCVLGSAVNVFAGCGGCGTHAKKKEAACSKKSACKGGCPMAKLKLTEEQKKKVAAAKAEFEKKLAGILTAEQLKEFKASCPYMGGKKSCCGTCKGAAKKGGCASKGCASKCGSKK